MFRKRSLLILSIAIVLLLTACGGDATVDPTVLAEQVMTALAQTVEAMPTSTPQPTETETPTASVTPSETPTQSPSLTLSPTSSPTAAAVATQAICDNAVFVSDVTVPDGTEMATGTNFTKTWKVQNTGTCTWDSEYALVFVNGNRMDGASPELLEKTVAPGESIDVSVAMVAPSVTGSYTGYWQLQNASDVTFGQMFYVQIRVVAGTNTATPTLTAATATPSNTPEQDTATPTEETSP